MNHPFLRGLLAAAWLSLSTFAAAEQLSGIQIAFLPDVHFHDVYGRFSDQAFAGVKTGESEQPAILRTMASQLQSTRLFNENYFAFRAALDDLAARKVKLVVLPGDFSDDGQPLHIRGLRTMLHHYQQQHGMRFLLTVGNHDPVHPWTQPGGKTDFLGSHFLAQAIFSPGSAPCLSRQSAVICSEEVRELGYADLLQQLGSFGFYPSPADIYWESPYSQETDQPYQYSRALQQASLAQRQYEICQQGAGGTYKRPHYRHCAMVPDVSYLVEPIPGLWLLAIDANVYRPQGNADTVNGRHRISFQGAGNAGYNAMFSHKPQVMEWIQQVVQRAKTQGKTLISFSHYPMTEFYQGQSQQIGELLGATQGQLARTPTAITSQALASSGLRLHFGGHMHLNNTALVQSRNGGTLVNVQSPSLAAYVPAYKLLTVLNPSQVKVQTITVEEVPDFNKFFAVYQQEWQQAGPVKPWDASILKARSYREFSESHLAALTRQRFLPKDWPFALRQLLLALNGQQMLVLSQLKHPLTLEQFQQQPELLQALLTTKEWQLAAQQLAIAATKANIDWADLATWRGFDLALDFYRLQNAGKLAFPDLSPQRLQQYRFFSAQLAIAASSNRPSPLKETPVWQQQTLQQYSQQQFSQILTIMEGFLNYPAHDDFQLDLVTGQLTPLPPD